MKQLVDWSASIWAGFISGAVLFIAIVVLLPQFEGGNAWVYIRLVASIVLGEGILPPPASYSLKALFVALGLHFSFSVGASMLLAFIIHRWGLIVGILGGGVFGLCLYAINFYSLTFFVPWMFGMKGLWTCLAHVLFGAVSGGVYELLEIEEFE